jgi:hypothetical protein
MSWVVPCTTKAHVLICKNSDAGHLARFGGGLGCHQPSCRLFDTNGIGAAVDRAVAAEGPSVEADFAYSGGIFRVFSDPVAIIMEEAA